MKSSFLQDLHSKGLLFQATDIETLPGHNQNELRDKRFLDYNDMKFIFEKYLTNKYENIIIDLNRPLAKLRKTVVTVLYF